GRTVVNGTNGPSKPWLTVPQKALCAVGWSNSAGACRRPESHFWKLRIGIGGSRDRSSYADASVSSAGRAAGGTHAPLAGFVQLQYQVVKLLQLILFADADVGN